MDKMILSQMAFYGYHGVLPEENKLGQRFLADVELSLPLSRAGYMDDLEETVNYAELYERIKNIVENRTFKLIEAVAEHVAADLLEHYSILQEVMVRITKPNPPFNIHFEGASVEICRRRPIEAFIGLGSNIGNRLNLLQEAVRLLSLHPRIKIVRQSSFYETDPIGYTEQEQFLNMAIAIRTDLPPEELMLELQRVEQQLGRKRDIRWGPRTIDLDLLLYSQAELRLPRLTIPHPRLPLRAFVLIPLAEIADDDSVPGIVSLSQHIEHLDGKDGVKKWIL
ncbi:MAG: 2-amino-4-hydroxy-6-hydroxymethyldihydropteridine diphosphokinase [Gorillibacterium sp.]|nr:2-amino-4-hydroxy-6-hydroxymethyldihydropteridine diphosphokinase [Gorillibacterium sp.]